MGAAAALLAAASPPLVAYAREGRPYALAILVAAALLWAAGSDDRRGTWSLVLLCAVGPAVQYTLFVVVGVVLGVRWWSGRRDTAAFVAAAASGSVLSGSIITQLGHRGSDLIDGHLAVIGGDLLLAPAAFAGFVLHGTPRWPVLGLLPLLLVVAGSPRVDRRIVGVTALPALALWGLAAVQAHPFGAVRQALVLAPALLLLLAAAWPRLSVGIVVLSTIATLARAPGVPVQDIEGLVDSLQPGPVFVHTPARWGAALYLPGEWETGEAPPSEFHGWAITVGRRGVGDLHRATESEGALEVEVRGATAIWIGEPSRSP